MIAVSFNPQAPLTIGAAVNAVNYALEAAESALNAVRECWTADIRKVGGGYDLEYPKACDDLLRRGSDALAQARKAARAVEAAKTVEDAVEALRDAVIAANTACFHATQARCLRKTLDAYANTD